MEYPTWDEFVVWNGTYEAAARVIYDVSYQTDKRIQELYELYKNPKPNTDIVLPMRSFFNDWEEGVVEAIMNRDDQVIPTEDELELQREEDKWKRFFNAPDSDFKFPHAIHKAEVTRLLKEGLKINAIRYVRQVSGKGLAEAKDWVDAYQKMEGL